MIYERAITLLSGRYGGRAAPQAYLEFAQWAQQIYESRRAELRARPQD